MGNLFCGVCGSQFAIQGWVIKDRGYRDCMACIAYMGDRDTLPVTVTVQANDGHILHRMRWETTGTPAQALDAIHGLDGSIQAYLNAMVSDSQSLLARFAEYGRFERWTARFWASSDAKLTDTWTRKHDAARDIASSQQVAPPFSAAFIHIAARVFDSPALLAVIDVPNATFEVADRSRLLIGSSMTPAEAVARFVMQQVQERLPRG